MTSTHQPGKSGHVRTLPPERRERNDPRQYDDLVDEWWRDRGGFAMLHWFAASRAQHAAQSVHVEAEGVDRIGVQHHRPAELAENALDQRAGRGSAAEPGADGEHGFASP